MFERLDCMQVQAAQLCQAEAERQAAPQPERRAFHLLDRSRVCHHLCKGAYIGQQSPGKPRVCCHCPCAHAAPDGTCLCHLQLLLLLLLLWSAVVTESCCCCCWCHCCLRHIHCMASSGHHAHWQVNAAAAYRLCKTQTY